MLGQLCLFRRWSFAVEACGLICRHQTFERTCCLHLRVYGQITQARQYEMCSLRTTRLEHKIFLNSEQSHPLTLTLTSKAPCSTNMLVSTYKKTTHHQNSKDHNLNNHHHEKSNFILFICGNKIPTRCNRVFIADLIACSTRFGHHYAHHQHPANQTHNPQLHTRPTT